MALHILISDDHNIVKIGLKLIIQKYWPEAVIKETDNFDMLIQLTKKESFDLIITDLMMPGTDSIEAIQLIKKRCPRTKILVFSTLDEQMYAVRYLRSGIDGYLHKLAAESEVRNAIKQILNTGKYFSETLKKQLVLSSLQHKHTQYQNPVEMLSDRELQVAKMLIRGWRPKDIASHLLVHIATISTYKSRIFEKLEVSDIAELIEKFRMWETSSDR